VKRFGLRSAGVLVLVSAFAQASSAAPWCGSPSVQTGACSGRNAVCTLPMTKSTAVRARFVKKA
jgi:hypothetical protein